MVRSIDAPASLGDEKWSETKSPFPMKFKLAFHYNSTAPTIVQPGATIGYAGADQGAAAKQYFLFPVSGVSKVSGSLEDHGSFSDGTASAPVISPATAAVLLFDGDIRVPGATIQAVNGVFAGTGLRFEIGQLEFNGGEATALSDVFVDQYVSNPDQYTVTISATPSLGSTVITIAGEMEPLS